MEHAVPESAAVEPERKPYKSIYLRWWFGHVVMLGISGFILTMAVLLHPSEQWVSLFGHNIPVVCAFRIITGHNCPGCGMTRSFAFLAHGQILEGFKMNLLGPFFFAFVAAQPPYRLYRLFRGPARRA